MCGCAGKTVKSLENTCHTWALLRWWFTTKRRYIKCMHYTLPITMAKTITSLANVTSCRRAAAMICLRPLQVDNIFVVIRQMARHRFRHVCLRYQQQVDLWSSDVQSGVRVTCDVGYRSANFSLPRPLSSRVRPDVRDRQMSDKSIA